jgi:monovalent cation/proton antiporter MnhG/PhaG subunit
MTIASLMLVVGVGFITIAALGVARLPDVFQRMHAATKAGGIGVTLVVGGALVAGGVTKPLTGILTIVLMLLTLSAASQLLARAAYVSGAEVQGLEGRDALAGVLARHDAPLEVRARAHDAPMTEEA